MKKRNVNYCINGNCSNCGNCCIEMLPLTIEEVKKIKAYVKENDIKPYSKVFFKQEGKDSVNLMCPFRDLENHKCKIYEVRPKICRVFKCNQSEQEIEIHKLKAHRRANYSKSFGMKKPIKKVYSMRELIYGDKLDTIRIIFGNLSRIEKSFSIAKIQRLLKDLDREDLADEGIILRVIDELKLFQK